MPCPHPNTHNSTHPKETTEKIKITVQTELKLMRRRKKIYYKDINVGQLKTFGLVWWELIFRSFEVGNEKRQDETFGEQNALTKLKNRIRPLVSYWCVSLPSLQTPLWETPPQTVFVMMFEGDFIAWFSEIVKVMTFTIYRWHLPYGVQNYRHRS